jgi:hypothetical protein
MWQWVRWCPLVQALSDSGTLVASGSVFPQAFSTAFRGYPTVWLWSGSLVPTTVECRKEDHSRGYGMVAKSAPRVAFRVTEFLVT